MGTQDGVIPRKSVTEASYAVHRPSEAGPSSVVPQPDQPDHDEDHHTRTNSPPPYSGPTSPSMSTPQLVQQSQSIYPGLPRLDYRLYSPPSFTLSTDQVTITSYDHRLSTYPASLVSLVKSLATVPPKPVVRITGGAQREAPDFDIKLNIMNLIVPDSEKGRMNYVKVIGAGEKAFRGEGRESTIPNVEGGLEEWARRFCGDASAIKQFTLERVVTNWDTSYLEGRLLSLVNSTSYRGHVTITFPLTHARVVVRNPDKVNRFFSNVTKVFTGTKKYEVVKSIWPYADVMKGEGRRVAVQSEEAWFENWKDSIRHAVLGKRHGWVTVEDRLEFMMERKIEESTSEIAPWG